VTKPPRILQAKQNRVVAHASYLLSFKPLHTISSAPRPAAEAATTRSTRFNSGLALLPPRPPRGSTESTPSTPSVRLPSPHPNNQNHTKRCTLPHSSSTADHALSPSYHSTATRFPTQNIPPVLSSLLPTNPVLEPRLTSQRKHVRLRRRRRLGIPGRSCIASGNVALWCEEFCLPIGMPGPVLQNLVISKPKVSLPILNDNHDHRPTLT
jgi:hypothetical protein